MIEKYNKMLTHMARQPLMVSEVMELEKCTRAEVHYAMEQAKIKGCKIQKLGNTPYTHFFLDAEELNKVRVPTMQENIRDIILAGDAWTYKELGDLLDLTQTQVRRAVATLIKLGEIEVNVRQIKPDKVWCTQLQIVNAEEPEF